jgi:hypothetical protein
MVASTDSTTPIYGSADKTSQRAAQGVRTKIGKMSKMGRHSLDCDPDEFSEKPGVF